MTQPNKRPREGILREDAGLIDAEGFIAPLIGTLEHVLHFTTAPSVVEKAKQVIEKGRLLLPGAVVVWNETIGRRKGARAIPKGWWANTGSLTIAFAFPPRPGRDRQESLSRTAAAVIRVIDSFRPNRRIGYRPSNDLVLGEKKMGAVFVEPHDLADLFIIRLNCSTELAKAPPAIASTACRLIDFIDARQLPLQKPETLPNTLLTRLMTELPEEFSEGR